MSLKKRGGGVGGPWVEPRLEPKLPCAQYRRGRLSGVFPKYPIFPKFYRGSFKRRFVEVGLLKPPKVRNIAEGVYAVFHPGSRYFLNSIEGRFGLVSDISQIL